jgi:hypothetical protein
MSEVSSFSTPSAARFPSSAQMSIGRFPSLPLHDQALGRAELSLGDDALALKQVAPAAAADFEI